MTSPLLRLRDSVAVAMIFAAGGCSSLNFGTDVDSLWRVASQGFSGSGRVTIEAAAAIPYATIGVQINDGPQGLLVLATDESGTQLWTSAARVAIQTMDGRVIRTSGLGHDLSGYTLRDMTKYPDGSYRRRWIADFRDLALYGTPISCEGTPSGTETITILGKPMQTIRTSERCHSEDRHLEWTFTNRYWADPASGLVWRSIQYVNPQLDALTIETLRPPG